MRFAVALILLALAQSPSAAERTTATAPAATPDAAALARMTPAELDQLRNDLAQRTAEVRAESAALARRVEELERLNAEAVAKKAALDAEYAVALERLTELEHAAGRD